MDRLLRKIDAMGSTERKYGNGLKRTARTSEDIDSVHTRSSADADNRLDAFSGQSRSTNMVPCYI